MLSLLLVAAALAETMVFGGVDVFDGENRVPAQDVIVRDGLIAAVGPAGSLDAQGVTPVTCEGCTLLPGLVDSHVHLNLDGSPPWGIPKFNVENNAKRYLEAGITTLVVARSGRADERLARRVEAGRTRAPHLVLSGPAITGPGSHPIPLLEEVLPWPVSRWMANAQPVAATAEEARERVDEIVADHHPDLFKFYFDSFPDASPHLSKEALVAGITEAKRLGLRPVVHAVTADDVVFAADAGASVLMHAVFKGRLTDAQVARLVEIHTPFVPTLQAFDWPAFKTLDVFTPYETETLSLHFRKRFLHPSRGYEHGEMKKWSADFEAMVANAEANTVAMIQAGVPFFAGTDGGVSGSFPGSGLHRELAHYVQLGIPTLDVLRSATSRPAEYLDEEHTFGRIEVGQRADLLLVRGDPTADIHALDDIVMVCLSRDGETDCEAP